MYSNILSGEIENRRYGIIISLVVHSLLAILFISAKLAEPLPVPPEPGGILVNLGVPDQEGTGNENAPEGKPAPVEEAASEPEETDPEPVKEKPQPEPSKPKPEASKPQPQKEVVTSEDPEAIALKKKKEQEKKQRDAEAKAQAEADRKAKEAADAEAKRKADQAAKEKALKDQIGGALGGGNGKGKGNSGKTGNPGDPNGGDSDILSGKSTGSGIVEGFGGRGFKAAPKPQDNSQETGTVAVRVCVDKSGKVTSAEFTQKGSTTSNSDLIRIAVNNAKQYKFNTGTVDSQCGTITYNFRVK